VMPRIASRSAPASRACRMVVCRVPWSLRGRMLMRAQSPWGRFHDDPTKRAAPLRFGTMRSVGAGGRPKSDAQAHVVQGTRPLPRLRRAHRPLLRRGALRRAVLAHQRARRGSLVRGGVQGRRRRPRQRPRRGVEGGLHPRARGPAGLRPHRGPRRRRPRSDLARRGRGPRPAPDARLRRADRERPPLEAQRRRRLRVGDGALALRGARGLRRHGPDHHRDLVRANGTVLSVVGEHPEDVRRSEAAHTHGMDSVRGGRDIERVGQPNELTPLDNLPIDSTMLR